jgi:hypothetical protein
MILLFSFGEKISEEILRKRSETVEDETKSLEEKKKNRFCCLERIRTHRQVGHE